MINSYKVSSRSGRPAGRQYVLSHALVILLLQIVTSEAYRLWSPQAYAPLKETASVKSLNPTGHGVAKPQRQLFLQTDSNVKLKLNEEQQLLHSGMQSNSAPFLKRQQSGFVQQSFRRKLQVSPLSHHKEFDQIVPNVTHAINLPAVQPPPPSSPTCNSVPGTTSQIPAQDLTQNPEDLPTSQGPSADRPSFEEEWGSSKPEEGSSKPEGGSSKPETVTGPNDGGNKNALCYAKPAPGRCRGAFKRYYYNVTLDQCDCYFFGGCEDRTSPIGEDTYLASLEHCLQTCSPGNKRAGPRCAGALRPPVFFLDPIDGQKRQGSKPRDVELEEDNR